MVLFYILLLSGGGHFFVCLLAILHNVAFHTYTDHDNLYVVLDIIIVPIIF